MSTAASAASAEPAASAPRVTARRARTRQRLLDAALTVFAEEGFGRSTVERVCDRAGFSRGAFYSNFSSLDELFLAMWEERSARMLADLRAALSGTAAPAPDPAAHTDPQEALRAAPAAIPVDDRWHRVTAEFTAHALRNPALRRVMAAREQAIRETLLPVVASALERAGRRVTAPDALGRALVAVHDGTATQVLLEPENGELPREREELFLNVLYAYSAPHEGTRTGTAADGTEAGAAADGTEAGADSTAIDTTGEPQ